MKNKQNNKMYSLRKIIGFVFLAALIVATSSCRNKEGSRTTGWDYNNPDMGGFEVADFIEQETGPGLVLIEGGTFVMGQTQDQVVFNTDNFPKRLTIRSFYMDQTEVSNVDYLEYLHWLHRIFTDRKYDGLHKKALPDTLVWRSKLGFNEPLVDNYFRHPAYHKYPVVGVSWVQASDYAKWRTDRVNEFILYREGIAEFNDSTQYNDANFNTEAYLANIMKYDIDNGKGQSRLGVGDDTTRRVKMEDGIFLPDYRLPTEAEWEYAALGLVENTMYERISQRKTYPWNGNYVRTADKKYYGNFVANFKRGRGDYMGVAGALNDQASIPTEVGSYFPNDYGLYNMGGNVSEWVLDVYRPSSLDDVDDLEGFRGNVFMTRDLSANQVDSMGRVKMVKHQPVKNRTNYRRADNINYLDGDENSLIDQQKWTGGAAAAGNNAGAGGGPGGATTQSPYQSTTNQMYGYSETSMINDEVRVYKGGSWKDPAYYLSPSVRRFLDQNQATNYIGFRCAMNRVGSPMTSGRR